MELRSQAVRKLAPENDPLKIGMGWKVDDLAKPQIMVESTFGDSHPGSAHLDQFVKEAVQAVNTHGGKAARYFATDMCDGIAQGHDGINYSLPHRDAIVNLVEAQANATVYDGGVFIASCDKSMPAMLMSMGMPLPKHVYGHGWLVIDGGKMSKSKGNVVDPYMLAERYGVNIHYVTEVTDVENGASTMTIYPPLGEKGANELGLTILCSLGDFDTLITGDMDAKTETKLVETYDLPDIEVLLVGHHGSKYSTGTTLLESVTPEAGVISVGDNSYGHPTEEALLRLTDAGMTVYRTDMQGNILITVD